MSINQFEGIDMVPGRVQAAIDVLRQMIEITQPQPGFPSCAPPSEPRDLDPSERRTYESALAALRQYFTGEMDLGEPAPRATEPATAEGQDAKPRCT